MLAKFAAEVAVQAQAAAEMDLESLGVTAVAVLEDLSLEPDIGNLDPGARVRAAVEVDRDRDIENGVEICESLFEFGHQNLCPGAGLGKGQLAEFDPAARHQVSSPV